MSHLKNSKRFPWKPKFVMSSSFAQAFRKRFNSRLLVQEENSFSNWGPLCHPGHRSSKKKLGLNRAIAMLLLHSNLLKAFPKVDHMTHFHFQGNHCNCFFSLRRLKYFSANPEAKDTVEMAMVTIFNGTTNTKIALYSYLCLTLEGNCVGWAYVRFLGEYSTACRYSQSRQSQCLSNNKSQITGMSYKCSYKQVSNNWNELKV